MYYGIASHFPSTGLNSLEGKIIGPVLANIHFLKNSWENLIKDQSFFSSVI